MSKRARLKTAAAVAILAALVASSFAPVAKASGLLTVGMEIDIGDHSCSLGFFAFNDENQRLAVTAGHCADDINQVVRAKYGVEIGTVVSHMPESDSLEPVRSRGYTLIRLYDDFDLETFFVGVTDAERGDLVTKSGARTGQTTGHITDVAYKGSWSEQTIIGSVVVKPGDSGGPWYTEGPTLVGISASSRYANGGGDYGGSQAQPVSALVNMIRQNARPWGAGLKVWIN